MRIGELYFLDCHKVYQKAVTNYKVAHIEVENVFKFDHFEQLRHMNNREVVKENFVGILLEKMPYINGYACVFLTKFGETYCWSWNAWPI